MLTKKRKHEKAGVASHLAVRGEAGRHGTDDSEFRTLAMAVNVEEVGETRGFKSLVQRRRGARHGPYSCSGRMTTAAASQRRLTEQRKATSVHKFAACSVSRNRIRTTAGAEQN